MSAIGTDAGFRGPAFPTGEYGALIFDCDGTLVDSMPVHYRAWHQALSACGLILPESRFYAMGGMPTHRIVRILAGEQGVAVNAGLLVAAKEEAFLKLMHLLRPVEPVVAVARHYRGQIPMAVASGGYRAVILQELGQIGCCGWFDAVVTAEDTERHKPDPDVFLHAARLLGVSPRDCLVYEDTDPGLQAAAAAGMDSVDIRLFHRPSAVAADP